MEKEHGLIFSWWLLKNQGISTTFSRIHPDRPSVLLCFHQVSYILSYVVKPCLNMLALFKFYLLVLKKVSVSKNGPGCQR